MIKEGAKFNGTSFVENTFSMKVTSRKGNAIQGTLYWDEAKKESKFKVTLFFVNIFFFFVSSVY
jgi:hypothetical protein